MVEVKRLDSGFFQILLDGLRSCYLIVDRKIALVECGFPGDYPNLVKGLSYLGLTVQDLDMLLLTHIHLDHAGGTGHLARDREGLRIYVHREGSQHLLNPERLNASVRRAYGEDKFRNIGGLIPVNPKHVELVEVTDGDCVDVGWTRLRVLETLGHAKHHVVFYDPWRRSVFSGDALGSRYIGLPSFILTPPPDYDPEKAKESICRIRELRPRTICFAHNAPYLLKDSGAFFDGLLEKHTVWVETMAKVMAEEPELNREEALQRFLEIRKELKAYPSQLFSFRLSVAGIMKYLRDRRKSLCISSN